MTCGSAKKVWWQCKECGYEWEAAITDRSGVKKSGCPRCNQSKGENIIYELKENDFSTIYKSYFNRYFDINLIKEESTKKFIKDIFMPAMQKIYDDILKPLYDAYV